MKRALTALSALLLALSLCACGGGAPDNTVFSPADLRGKTAGALLGSPAETYLYAAGASVSSYTGAKDMASDLVSGRLDCIAADSATASKLLSSSRKLAALDAPLADETYRVMVALENPDLTADLDRAIAALKADGTLSKLLESCLSGSDYASGYTEKENAKFLTAAVDPTFPPYCWKDESGEVRGLDVETARALCSYLGLNLRLLEVPSEKLLSAVQNGRAAFAIGRITLDETAQVDFTEPYMEASQVILVRK